MRRYVPSNFDQIRSKAKLFHRCIDIMRDDGIGFSRPGYRLTDAQGDLARAFGFSNWAEIKAVVASSPGESLPDPECFSSIAQRLAGVVGSQLVATSLLVRLGLAAGLSRIPRQCIPAPDATAPTERVRAVDLIIERLMEVDDFSSDEARVVLDIIQTSSTQMGHDLETIGFVESVLAWGRYRTGERSPPANYYPAEGDIERLRAALPRNGVFIMAGPAGSGRSHAGITLARAMRNTRRAVFSVAVSAGLGRHASIPAGSVVFMDDIRWSELGKALEIADHSLVIFCATGSSWLDVSHRVRTRAMTLGRSGQWWLDHDVGGVFIDRREDGTGFAAEPWREGRSRFPATVFFVNDEGLIFDDFEDYLQSLSLQLIFERIREIRSGNGRMPELTVDSDEIRVVKETAMTCFRKNTDPSVGWRGSLLVSKTDEVFALLFRKTVDPWLRSNMGHDT